MRYIGDVHGKMDKYIPLTYDVASVQVGDFGVGFVDVPQLKREARFIRGNHDHPELCRQHPNWIPDGTVENDTMFVGGAWSIDQAYRREGVSWWRDEELSMAEWDRVISTALVAGPRVMVTHDCPRSVVEPIFGKIPLVTRTQQALDVILDQVQPDVWIFGHWHENVDKVVGRTRFICLGELQWIDL